MRPSLLQGSCKMRKVRTKALLQDCRTDRASDFKIWDQVQEKVKRMAANNLRIAKIEE